MNNNTLRLVSEQTIGNIALYSIAGRKILTQSIDQSNFDINIVSLSSGIYLAQIEDAFGRKQTIKFIKE